MAEEVQIYTTQYCPYCHAAKNFLKEKKVAFTEIDVTNDDAMREELLRRTGKTTVPQIFVKGRPIGGYDDLVRLYKSGQKIG